MQGNTEAFARGRRRVLTVATFVTVGVTWALAGCGQGTTAGIEARPVTSASGSPEPTGTSTPSTTPAPTSAPVTTPPAAEAAASGVVSRVVDGDTVDVAGTGRIRIIGIDTPESGACGYQKATALMEQLVLGRTVQITAAPAKDNADQYGRLLRYVDVGGVDAGLEELKAGFAVARYDSRDGYGAHPREATYIATDRQVPSNSCAAAPPAPAAAAADPECDPAYPTVCIPPAPPDLDCSDISYRRFKVLAPDPHRFDADHDGIGCESG